MNAPKISVIVPTRNRPDQIRPCVDSILANADSDFELLVVDQSDGPGSEQAWAEPKSDQRLRYLRSSLRGAANARNAGITGTTGALMLFTDDDCRVPDDWVRQWRTVFDADPEAALGFGRVELPADLGGGYAASFEPDQREYQGALPAPGAAWGISANMAARRSLFDKIGLLDTLLGAGARFIAAEETDLLIRTIAAGKKVVNVAEASVLHLGIRAGSEASQLFRGYGIGLGAAFLKHLRLRTNPGALLLLQWVLHHGSQSARRALSGERPTGLGFVAGMLIGAGRALRVGVDPKRGVFQTT